MYIIKPEIIIKISTIEKIGLVWLCKFLVMATFTPKASANPENFKNKPEIAISNADKDITKTNSLCIFLNKP